MKKPDKESQRLIAWAIQQLQNDKFFTSITRMITQQMEVTYSQEQRATLLHDLQTKMTKGALLHGAPTQTSETLQKEIRQELLDLIGWNLVLLWKQHKNLSQTQ